MAKYVNYFVAMLDGSYAESRGTPIQIPGAPEDHRFVIENRAIFGKNKWVITETTTGYGGGEPSRTRKEATARATQYYAAPLSRRYKITYKRARRDMANFLKRRDKQ